MCFHTQQTADAVTLAKRFKVKVPDNKAISSDHYISFNYPLTPVIASNNMEQIQLFHWGLIPGWSKDNEIRKFTLNAKIETLKEKPSFKYSINNRCMILVNSFMEWQWLDAKGKNKQKYLIGMPDDEPFAIAGIWNNWLDKSTGEVIDTYTMITTEANELMSTIHNTTHRMPVILSKENEMLWMEGEEISVFVRCNPELKAVPID